MKFLKKGQMMLESGQYRSKIEVTNNTAQYRSKLILHVLRHIV